MRKQVKFKEVFGNQVIHITLDRKSEQDDNPVAIETYSPSEEGGCRIWAWYWLVGNKVDRFVEYQITDCDGLHERKDLSTCPIECLWSKAHNVKGKKVKTPRWVGR